MEKFQIEEIANNSGSESSESEYDGGYSDEESESDNEMTRRDTK